MSDLCRMLAGHWEGNPNVVFHKAKGSGGPQEMAGALDEGEVMYGLGNTIRLLLLITLS